MTNLTQFPPDRHVEQLPTSVCYTRYVLTQVSPPDDEHLMLETCRGMK
jgi:hypothetical protein